MTRPSRSSTPSLLTDALKKAGVEVEMVVVKGGGHNIVPPVHDAKVNEFLDKHLKKFSVWSRTP